MVERKPKSIEDMEKECLEDSQKWFGDMDASRNFSHHALGMAGEVGEFCNLVKKVERGSLRFGDAQTRHDLAMELTDVFVYMLNLAGMMQIDLAKTYEMVRAANDKRFTAERKDRESK